MAQYAIVLEVLLDEVAHAGADFTQEDRLLHQVGGAHKGLSGPPMVGPDDEGQFICTECLDLQVRAVRGRLDEGNGYLMRGESLQNFVGCSAQDMNASFGQSRNR